MTNIRFKENEKVCQWLGIYVERLFIKAKSETYSFKKYNKDKS